MVYSITLGHNIAIRFAPSVYNYILSLKCDLEDLRVEDATVHRYKYTTFTAFHYNQIVCISSLMYILRCGDPNELDELTFTVSNNHFGALQTIELEDGGTMKSVTMDNKCNYVYQMCQWYLTGNVPTYIYYVVVSTVIAYVVYIHAALLS